MTTGFDDRFRAQLLDLFRWRRDVRRFQTVPLAEGVLERLIETACLAPSVGLSEPWCFVTVDDPARRRAVRDCFVRANAEAQVAMPDEDAAAYGRLKLAGLDDAPCQFAVFVARQPSQGRGLGRATMPETLAYSAVMAVHTLWLAARAQGIGLGWVSIVDPQRVAEVLEMAPGHDLIGYFCLGFAVVESDVPELQLLGWETRRSATILRR